MNTISIYLKPSGSVAELKKDFAMYVGSYQNKLIDVYVPKEMIYADRNQGLPTNSVKIGGFLTAPNGERVKTNTFFLAYLKETKIFDPILNELVEYVVYERILPKELTLYPGNQEIVVNVVSMNWIDSFGDLNPTVLQVVTSQTCELQVELSDYFGDDGIVSPTKLEEVWGQVNKNTQNIETILNDFSMGENYIGRWSGIYLPTTSMLDTFVDSVEHREPQNGDTIIYVLQIQGETDKNYKYIYTNSGWESYEIPPIEQASNGSLGLIQGTYTMGKTGKTLVDIQNGEIVAIYVLDNNETYRNITDYVNLNAINIEYMQQNGASKDFVKDYSMPRLFNDVYFIGSNGYQDTVPTTPADGVQFSVTTNNIGDFQIAQLEKDNTFDFELASKNGYKNNFFVSVDVSCEAMFRLTTECKLGDEDWQTLDVDITNLLSFTPDNISKVVFDSPFGYLGENVINLTNGDKIRQTLEVITQDSSNKTFKVYSNEIYPSVFYFTSQSYTQAGGGGTTNYNELTNKPSLNTDNSTSQLPDANETLSGVINLHKVSKTGKLADMIQDATHRTVTDAEKQAWNNGSGFDGSFTSLTNVPIASEGVAGIIQIATDQEAEIGTNTTKAVNSKQLQTAIQGLGNVFNLKGTKATVQDLPSTGNEIGDVWYVVSEQVGYIWLNDGTQDKWEQFGAPINLSGYVQYIDIINTLTSTDTTKPLSAYQGKVLKDLYDELNQETLKFPTGGSTEIELVGIDDNGDQVMVQIDAIVGANSDNPVKSSAVAYALENLETTINNTIGNISTLLDTINGEVI